MAFNPDKYTKLSPPTPQEEQNKTSIQKQLYSSQPHPRFSSSCNIPWL